ncbi:MAG TPA: hypothetical protein P5564_07680 [Paludibacteraceae bacterium]|nr:hypothetical protein [Paludibacteraceae bacterium]
MSQPIKITHQNGEVFDTSPNMNIELNMGGVSLLNLSEKTVSYTNAFTLPRTPNNDKLFDYSGFKDSKNRPKIKIFIQKGLFFKGALMTVRSVTNSGYSCSIAYDENDIITALANSYPYELYASEYFYPFNGSGYIYNLTTDRLSEAEAFEQVIYGAAQKLAIIDDLPEDGSRPIFTIFTNTSIICHTDQEGFPNYTDNGNVFSGVWHLLHWISKSHGLKLTGSVIDDPYFQRLMIRQPSLQYLIDEIVQNCYTYLPSAAARNAKTTNKDVLNAILKMFFAEFSVENGEFRIDKITDKFARSYEGVRIEGFTFEKDMTSGYSSNKNYITYKAKDEADKYYASDYFEGEGSAGVTDVVTINSIIPDTDSVGYVTTPEAIGNDLMLAIDDESAERLEGQLSWNFGVSLSNIETIKKAAILDIAPVYSSFMSDIFKKPIILDVTGYMDMLTMDQVMKKRVIYSVGLGGQFWVETLAYSLVSGNCKMKLIKIF